MHHHLPGRRNWSRRVCRQCLREHFPLTGLRQFPDCRDLGDANPHHFRAVRLESADVSLDDEVCRESVRGNFVVNVKAFYVEQDSGASS